MLPFFYACFDRFWPLLFSERNSGFRPKKLEGDSSKTMSGRRKLTRCGGADSILGYNEIGQLQCAGRQTV